MALSNTEKQKARRERMKAAGMVYVCEWVPATGRDRLKKLAAELRKEGETSKK